MSEELKPPRFPTMLRKMWSGSEVQAWIDENWSRRAQPEPLIKPDDLFVCGQMGANITGVYAQPEPAAPAVKPMTAHRAIYFMERFQKEEKLLGPNEQAAVRFVLEMLERADAAPSVAPEPVDYCWSVSLDGRFLFHSASLHDARLRLDGDFEWCEDRFAFAKELLEKLNAAHPPRAPLTCTEALEVWAACADAGSIASTNAAVAIVRETERRHGISAAAIGEKT